MSSAGKQFHAGWLWKWTNYVSGYQKRWFLLSGDVLSYYTCCEETGTGCRGNVILSSASWFRENQHNFRIEVKGSFTYYLKADDAVSCDKWLSTLDKARRSNTSSRIMGQGLSTRDIVEGILLPLEAKLEEVTASCDATSQHGEVLLTELQELEKDIQSSQSSVTRRLTESMTAFRMTSSSMMKSCSEFSDLVHTHVKDWRTVLMLDGAIPEGMESADEEEAFEDAAETPFVLHNDGNIRHSSRLLGFTESNRPSNHTVLCNSAHRKSIPHKPVYNLNLWSVLKYCIGRDISKLPVPVNFSEPISILQKLVEDLEYSELLDKAALCEDPCTQLAYVAAFSISAYSTTGYRTGKPFNPMLGETFELDSLEELGFRFIAEQVSHHPPKAAIYAESSKNNGHGGWSYWQDVMPSSKFRGNYLTLTPIGTWHLLFHDTGNHYTWNKVTITVNNIILGKLWFDQSGVSEIVNHKTKDRCSIKFHAYSFYEPSNFRKVFGTVENSEGVERYQIFGRWDEEIRCQEMNSNTEQRREEFTLWRINPLPEQAERMYNFTRLAMILNELDESCAPTDSRRRPDQRKMEEGLWDDANQMKLILEEKQRERGKLLVENDNAEQKKKNCQVKQYQPLWFNKQLCPITGESVYIYNHKYWDAKEKQEWTNCPDIFSTTGGSQTSVQMNWPLLVKASRIHDPSSNVDSSKNADSLSLQEDS